MVSTRVAMGRALRCGTGGLPAPALGSARGRLRWAGRRLLGSHSPRAPARPRIHSGVVNASACTWRRVSIANTRPPLFHPPHPLHPTQPCEGAALRLPGPRGARRAARRAPPRGVPGRRRWGSRDGADPRPAPLALRTTRSRAALPAATFQWVFKAVHSQLFFFFFFPEATRHRDLEGRRDGKETGTAAALPSFPLLTRRAGSGDRAEAARRALL